MAEQTMWPSNWANPTSGASSDAEGPTYNVGMNSGAQSSSWTTVATDSTLSQGGNWQETLNTSSPAASTQSGYYDPKLTSPSQFVPKQDEFQFVSSTGSLNKGITLGFL